MSAGRGTPRNNRFFGRRPYYRGRGYYGGRGWPRREAPNDRNTDHNESLGTMEDYYPAVSCPYKGWKLYFSNESYRENHPHTEIIKIFENYFNVRQHQYNIEDIENRKSFTVDVKKLLTDTDLQNHTDDLKKQLTVAPEILISCMSLAMHQHIYIKKQEELIALQNETDDDDDDDPEDLSAPYNIEDVTSSILNTTIFARLVNVEPEVQMCDLKASYYGKLVCIKGTVVRVGDIKPYCTQMEFQCLTCNQLQTFPLISGKYKTPTKCASRECRGRSFMPNLSSKLTKTIDWQNIRIQEMNDARQDVGRVPRTVECELSHDLVDSCVPGDVVVVTGVVKVNNSSQGYQRNQQDKCLFLLYIEANSICNSRGTVSGRNTASNVASTSRTTSPMGGIGMQFSLKELYAVQEIQAQENLFHLIVNSLCPAIYGHEMVKAGLVLGLFGGSQKYANDKNRIPVRGDPHVLVVGDPGIGKSQMLQACSNVSPRGVYICGHTTTTTGLTVTITKDGSHDNSLEAGALVLSDQGCCCIDELDKMGTQQQALLEAMEQQCISIAKAGIVCNLPARTSVLAAANPVGGHYNKAKTVSENLKIGAALLSRFDLVFILLDKPDEEMDSMLSEHVMALHAAFSTTKQPEKRNTSLVSLTPTLHSQNDFNHSKSSLSEQLKLRKEQQIDGIPHQLLRKYIGYARQYVHPKLTRAAAGVLREFYLELRKHHHTMDSTPITTRQLESLVRLSEARARLELREDVTEDDARDVVEIMKHSMIDTYSNAFGVLDFRRSQHGSGMSSRSLAKRFISILTSKAAKTNQSLYTMQQMRDIMKEYDLHVQDFEGFVDSLNNHGFLLKKGPRLYQLHTV